MKFSRVLTIVLLVTAIAGSASAFNGLRKGFVLGGGLGYAPYIKSSGFLSEDSEPGVGINILLGYAWDQYNMLVYEVNAAGCDERGEFVSQQFEGAAWYHYFGPQGKSFFTTVGIGFAYYTWDDYETDDRGGAYLVGGGYEFARHFQIALYFSGGKTTMDVYGSGVDMGHNHLNILINAVAF